MQLFQCLFLSFHISGRKVDDIVEGFSFLITFQIFDGKFQNLFQCLRQCISAGHMWRNDTMRRIPQRMIFRQWFRICDIKTCPINRSLLQAFARARLSIAVPRPTFNRIVFSFIRCNSFSPMTPLVSLYPGRLSAQYLPVAEVPAVLPSCIVHPHIQASVSGSF